MNLIEKFENMPFQDVGTFNSIFTDSPILGFPMDTSVEIKELVAGTRRVLVGEETLFLDLLQKVKRVPVKKEKVEKVVVYEKVSKKQLSLSDIYKRLKPTEFMIFSAIKEVGEVHGVEEFARNLPLSNKTIANSLKRLVELRLVKTEYVTCESGSFTKIIIDTENTF